MSATKSLRGVHGLVLYEFLYYSHVMHVIPFAKQHSGIYSILPLIRQTGLLDSIHTSAKYRC
jgi:hypothetical protein